EEEVYINALADGVNVSYSQLLPSDDWGFAGPNSEIFLGPEFDNILAFSFTREANAVGFGMDEFFIDEEPPNLSTVPEPTSTAVLFLALAGMGLAYRKQPA
ncbi:PEP-CTERM sorting domain-containing protein, partial [Leptolyngbya cf. ectocarpi LEGE 11479]